MTRFQDRQSYHEPHRPCDAGLFHVRQAAQHHTTVACGTPRAGVSIGHGP